MIGISFTAIFAFCVTTSTISAANIQPLYYKTIQEDDCVEGEFAPFVGDCMKFLQCTGGVWVTQDCPPHLIWDQSASECVNPGEAVCDNSTTIGPTEETTTTSTTITTTTTTTPTTTTPTTTTPTTTTTITSPPTTVTPVTYPPDVPVPGGDCIIGTYAPFPGICTKFLQCDESHWVEEDCPDELIWDQSLLNCVDYGVCSNSSTVSPSTRITTARPATTTPEPTECENGEYLPFPDNCTLYIQCIEGRWYVEQCPTLFIWDQSILDCVVPDEDETCNGGGNTDTPSTGTESTDSTDGTETEYTDGTDSTVTQSTDTTEVPTPGGYCRGVSYAPYPGDCTRFLQCDENQWSIKDCPADLIWDQELLNCIDYGVCQYS